MRIPRKIQLAGTGIFHEYFRGHNQTSVFRTLQEKTRYLDYLCDAMKNDAIAAAVMLYSFCIMSNHSHQVGEVALQKGKKGKKGSNDSREKAIARLGDLMRNAHSRFAQWYNRLRRRSGAVFDGRPKTKQVACALSIIEVMLYGDANPVRARMVAHPAHYRWSSYRFYAFGETSEYTAFLTLPPAYLALGKTPELRQRAYRSLMDAYLRRNGLLDDKPDDDVVDLSMYATGMECILALIADAGCREGPVIA